MGQRKTAYRTAEGVLQVGCGGVQMLRLKASQARKQIVFLSTTAAGQQQLGMVVHIYGSYIEVHGCLVQPYMLTSAVCM
jgi:hypothetical protein